MAFKLSSPAFGHGGEIPAVYTCDGKNVSPRLIWSGAPPGTQSLALIVDDPDAPDPAAPKTTWVHWIVYNLPPEASELPDSASAAKLPGGSLEGLNDWKRTGYGGPCPPVGCHRYFFKLYALDRRLADLHRPAKARLEQAMERHVLARAELIGTYERRR